MGHNTDHNSLCWMLWYNLLHHISLRSVIYIYILLYCKINVIILVFHLLYPQQKEHFIEHILWKVFFGIYNWIKVATNVCQTCGIKSRVVVYHKHTIMTWIAGYFQKIISTESHIENILVSAKQHTQQITHVSFTSFAYYTKNVKDICYLSHVKENY